MGYRHRRPLPLPRRSAQRGGQTHLVLVTNFASAAAGRTARRDGVLNFLLRSTTDGTDAAASKYYIRNKVYEHSPTHVICRRKVPSNFCVRCADLADEIITCMHRHAHTHTHTHTQPQPTRFPLSFLRSRRHPASLIISLRWLLCW